MFLLPSNCVCIYSVQKYRKQLIILIELTELLMQTIKKIIKCRIVNHNRILYNKAKEIEELDTGNEKAYNEKKYMLRCFKFFYLHHRFIEAIVCLRN